LIILKISLFIKCESTLTKYTSQNYTYRFKKISILLLKNWFDRNWPLL